MTTPERPPAEVVAFFDAAGFRWRPLAGGFSGAPLWRGDSFGRPAVCLKGHPPDADRLRFAHRLARLAAAALAPARVSVPQPGRAGETVCLAANRAWESTAWVDGTADFRDRPTAGRLDAVADALAALHGASEPSPSRFAPCPAVARRLAAADDWHRLTRDGWRPGPFAPGDPAARLWAALPAAMERLPGRLAAWRDRPVPVLPCHCDLHHDHWLFDGDHLAGLIDFAAAKADHPAVDLARVVGSLLGGDRERADDFFDRYARRRPLPAADRELALALDETGVAVAAANWLRWLYHDRRPFADRAAAGRRLAELAGRLAD